MNTVAVRPNLERRYDVIQSAFPQFLGSRDRLEDAMALAEWAARRIAPCKILVFGTDGARIEETLEVQGDGTARPAPAAH
jgi:hypothetical protein